MTNYTKEDNLANACVHICVMSQDMEISKEELLEGISLAYDSVSAIEDKEKFVQFLQQEAIKKVFGV